AGGSRWWIGTSTDRLRSFKYIRNDPPRHTLNELIEGEVNRTEKTRDGAASEKTPRHVSTKRPPDRDNCQILIFIAQPLMNPFKARQAAHGPTSALSPLRPLTECELVRVFIKALYLLRKRVALNEYEFCAPAPSGERSCSCSSDKSADTAQRVLYNRGQSDAHRSFLVSFVSPRCGLDNKHLPEFKRSYRNKRKIQETDTSARASPSRTRIESATDANADRLYAKAASRRAPSIPAPAQADACLGFAGENSSFVTCLPH
ncbi:hypothetical protein EVAR_99257_1, partial [Eumeta japonica]